MKKKFSIFIMSIFVFGSGYLYGMTPEESFKKNFPLYQYDTFTPSTVKGLYEVMKGDMILYFSPETENVFIGEIITKENRNLTQEKIQAKLALKIKNVDLEKAVKIGSGKNKVIEFTNPDCSYCRRASQFLAGRLDMTRHLFFVPLPVSRETQQKVKYIFCAADKSKAYEEAMTGKLDDLKFKLCEDAKIDELMKNNQEISNMVGIRATPYFSINDTVVRGADIPRLQSLLDAGIVK